MICKLCQKNKANKRNTHYLTDSIIRKALNLEGSNDREKGFSFDMSNNKNFIEFNFQRGTPMGGFEEEVGRQATDEEIEKAKERLFAVDYVFCSDCEDLFGKIEELFCQQILPKLRSENLEKKKELLFREVKLIRLFFFLQIWRNSICEESFNLSKTSEEKLREFILNYDKIDLPQLTEFPLSITFLETLGGDERFTSNLVGSISDKNPYLIFMNDFIIQFYDSEKEIKFF